LKRQVFVNLSGGLGGDNLPSHSNFIWRGEALGESKAVSIRPTDKHYSEGSYYVSVVSHNKPVDAELVMEITPYGHAIGQAEPDMMSIGGWFHK